MTANVYIDGFNLYYGLLKDTDYRWLNLSEFCRLLLPAYDVQQIKYFTARVQAHPHDPQAPVRQQMYLRALDTLPDVEVFYGQFSYHKVRMPLANGQGTTEVVKAEEKGSDVALAVHALHDAHMERCDTAVIISNDSDIVPALNIIRQELQKQVYILFPTCAKKKRWPCHDLKCACDGYREIRNWSLKYAQFAETLTDAVGIFHKPQSW